MRNPDGQVTVVGDFRTGDPTVIDPVSKIRHTEATIDTFSCGHCQKIVHVPPRTDPAVVGGGCRICQRNICPRCVAKGECVPFEEALARIEARRSYGI